MLNKRFDKNEDRKSTSETKNKSSYFLYLSGKYKKASHIIYMLLAAVFVVTLVFNSSLLTYTNFNYLFRDINAAAEAAGDNYNSISYTNDELRVVKNYRGGIITVSSTDMAIYTATGRRTLYQTESFVSPQIATSQKYAVIYEVGEKRYSVYNSFAKVGGETLKYPISYATACDNGWFAVVTRDAEHASVVYLYDDDMQLRNTYSFASSNVFSVALNEKGTRIAIFKTETDIDKFSTSVMVCEVGSDKKLFDAKVSEGLVCGTSFAETGNIQLVCTDGYFMIDSSNGKIIKAHSFDGKPVNRASVTSQGSAVSLTNNTGAVNNSILVFDEKGKIVYETDIEEGILDMEYYDEYLFINQGNSISKINIKNDSVVKTDIFEKGSDIIVYDSNNILLCCQTKAKYIKT